MLKFHRTVVAIATAVMVIGTAGAGMASASSSSSSCVSRAQFIYDFAVASGITPVYPASSDFSDVSSSSPYYGYIEAAYRAGLIGGTGGGLFDPSGCLTRAQIAKIEVLALGDSSQASADATSSTTFSDDSSIPSWARGFIVEAVALGLVHGYPDGSFDPNATLTPADESFFLSQYKSVENALTLTVTASATDVAVGQAVTVTATGTSEPVSFSTTAGAVISGDSFIGSTPGNYTVTAATTDGLKATVAIAVYGPAVGLKINLPSTVVADLASQYTATVDIVDANGNTVGNNTDSIKLSDASISIAGIDDGTGFSQTLNQLAAVNGVATFTIDAGTLAGASETLKATDEAPATTVPTDTATLTTTAEVATSISVTAPTYVSANQANTGTASATVLDQTGNPMISGTYSVSISLTGPAAFTADSTTGPETGAFVGSTGPVTTADFPFTSIQSETGAITFTASATGLTAGTATSTAVIAGAPVALQVTQTKSSVSADTAGGVTGDLLTVTAVDSHGYPAQVPSNDTLTVTDDSNSVFVYGSGSIGTPDSSTAGPNSSGPISVTWSGSNAPTGSYTITVTDSLGLTSGTATLAVTPGSPYQIGYTGAQADEYSAFNEVYVTQPVTDPNFSVTYQVMDAEGNPVPASGITLTASGTGTGEANPTFTSTTEVTNSLGQATFTGQVGPYEAGPTNSTSTTIHASGPNLGSANNYNIYLYTTVPTSLTAQVTDTNASSPYHGSHTQAMAGDSLSIALTESDPYAGVQPWQDDVEITLGGTGSVSSLLGGRYNPPALLPNGSYLDYFSSAGLDTMTATAATTGTITLKVNDIDLTDSTLTATTAVNVAPGQLDGLVLVDASSKVVGETYPLSGVTVTAPSFTAGTPVKLTLEAVDAYGNPVVVDSQNDSNPGVGLRMTLTPGAGTHGEYRTSENGADVASNTSPGTFTIGEGMTGITVYYVPATTGSYKLTPDFFFVP